MNDAHGNAEEYYLRTRHPAVHYLKMKNHVSLHRKEDLDMHSNAVLNNTILDRKIWHYTWMCLFQDMYLHLWPHMIAFNSSISNIWGPFVCVLILAYTLLEVPKSLWNAVKYTFMCINSHLKNKNSFKTKALTVNSCCSLFCRVQFIIQRMHICRQTYKDCCHFEDNRNTSAPLLTSLVHSHRQVLELQATNCPEKQWERVVGMQVIEDKVCDDVSYEKLSNQSSEYKQLNSKHVNNSVGIEFWPFIQTSSCVELQSPVNICIHSVTCKRFAPLVFIDLIKEEGHAYLSNINQTATVVLEGCTPLLEGGPLRGSYKFAQLHFHWSLKNNAGSEHALDGMHFSMESHAVYIHIRCENITEALDYVNGIAVVANFLQVCDEENENFLPISNNLNRICVYNSVADIPRNCFSWMNNNGHSGYITYPGSLTTPLKSKTVTWILFPDPVPISSSQINCFRELQDDKAQRIQQNCRNVQNLNDREIYFAV